MAELHGKKRDKANVETNDICTSEKFKITTFSEQVNFLSWVMQVSLVWSLWLHQGWN